MLTAILRAHPQLHGILFDLPKNAIDDARPQITSLDIADRCQLVAGDMFKPEKIPHADAYVMRQIIVAKDLGKTPRLGTDRKLFVKIIMHHPSKVRDDA